MFYYIEVSRWLILALGGFDETRLIHRWTGVAFMLLMLQHMFVGTLGMVFLRWQPSLLITKHDFQDLLRNIRYYIGLVPGPAACGRFDYKEKFVYWLVVTGGMIMATTGLALWHPTKVVSLLPGQMIPAAKVMHSNEGMLIFLLLAVWHIYDSIFSPVVFPLDTSIFSGYISRDRMLREHPLELAELEGVSLEGLTHGEGSKEEPG